MQPVIAIMVSATPPVASGAALIMPVKGFPLMVAPLMVAVIATPARPVRCVPLSPLVMACGTAASVSVAFVAVG